MITENQAPVNWIREVGSAIQWPVIVFAAFWLGRQMTKLEARVLKAEKSMSELIDRHMPHVHSALQRVESSLAAIQAVVFSRSR